MIVKKNKFFLVLLIFVAALFGCSKNALFHTKDIKRPNHLRYNNKGPGPVFIEPIEPIEPIESVHPIDTTTNDGIADDTALIPATQSSISTNPARQVVSPVSANTAPVVQQEPEYVFEDFFSYRWIQRSFQQVTNEKNKTTLFFQAFDQHGLNIRDLQKNDLHLLEDQIEIKNYTLSSERQRFDHDLDIVFAMDTSGSMKRYIDMVRNNIVYFIDKLKEDQIHTNLCLVTFRDLVEKECEFFYPDNPITPEDENTLKFLIDLSNLKLHKGGTYQENALGGVLTAARDTPWNPGNQRMIVLITDAPFWTPLYNESYGYESGTSPWYATVSTAVTENATQVFAITQDHGGFSKDYHKQPSLVEETSGQWFNIKSLEERDMQALFDHIRDQLNVFYKIEYFVEDQEGLNTFLSLEDRKINLTTNATQDENTQIEVQDIQSSLPEGSKLQSRWPLGEREVKDDNISVTVNGDNKELGEDFSIEDGQILFLQPPPGGSEILVRYDLEGLINNIQKHPLILQPPSQLEASSFSLILNGKEADHTYFEIEPVGDGKVSLNLKNEVFSDEDPFDIRQSNGLNISLSYKAI